MDPKSALVEGGVLETTFDIRQRWNVLPMDMTIVFEEGLENQSIVRRDVTRGNSESEINSEPFGNFEKKAGMKTMKLTVTQLSMSMCER